jgi:RNA-directed DNA polymerase
MKIEASSVSETTKRDAGVLESCVQRKFTPAPLWTEAMLAALQRGVKGGKWHSLIDKVWHPDTLMLAWTQVERNAGAAGVDRVSVERFAQARDYYLAELASTLRDGSYRPQPVRRVYIPKGAGQRPLGIPAVKDRCRFAFMVRLFAFHDETYCLAVSFPGQEQGFQRGPMLAHIVRGPVLHTFH